MAKKKTGGKKTAKKATKKATKKPAKKSRVSGISYQKKSDSSGGTKDPVVPDNKVSVGFGSFSEPAAAAAPAPARAAPRRSEPAPSGGANSEAGAVISILRALEGLEPSQVERVISAVVEEYAASLVGRSRPAAEPTPSREPAPQRATAKGQTRADDARLGFDNLPEFIDGAGIKSPSMRALLCAYWMQVVERSEDFLPTDLESEMALMQIPVRDMDEAFSALLGKGYVTEVPSQRELKRFMLTPQGMNAVWELFG